MKIKTYISFEWDTDNENGDRLEQTPEEWAKYFKTLMVEDINTLTINNELMEAILVEQIQEGEL